MTTLNVTGVLFPQLFLTVNDPLYVPAGAVGGVLMLIWLPGRAVFDTLLKPKLRAVAFQTML